MKDNMKGISGLIFLVVSLILMFVFKSIIAIIFAIIALIIGISNLKYKSVVAWILLIGSLLVIAYSIFSFCASFFTINKMVSGSKIRTYKNYESTLEYETELYLEGKNTSGQSEIVTIKELEDNGMKKYNNSCDGYVIYNSVTDKYNAYIKCDGYQTSGFNLAILEDENNNVSIPNEIYSLAEELANNYFDLSRIFETGHLSFEHTDSNIAKVNDSRFLSFTDLEKIVNDTFVESVANELLYGENAIYFDKDGELYINLNNASLANVYTGRDNADVSIKNYSDTSFIIEANIKAYLDDTRDNFENISLTLIAVKQYDNSLKLSKMGF